MGHHKRKGPKSARSGCLLCKPHKRQGVDAPTRQEQRGRDTERYYTETYYGMDPDYDPPDFNPPADEVESERDSDFPPERRRQ